MCLIMLIALLAPARIWGQNPTIHHNPFVTSWGFENAELDWFSTGTNGTWEKVATTDGGHAMKWEGSYSDPAWLVCKTPVVLGGSRVGFYSKGTSGVQLYYSTTFHDENNFNASDFTAFATVAPVSSVFCKYGYWSPSDLPEGQVGYIAVRFYTYNTPTETQQLYIDDITVYDGTLGSTAAVYGSPYSANTSNNVVPIYGERIGSGNMIHSQFIIPAQGNGFQLHDQLTGTYINELSFLSSVVYQDPYENVSWGDALFTVKLAEVDVTSFPSAELLEVPMTTVMSAKSLCVGRYNMMVPFDQPYYYHGGNLLVEIEQVNTGYSNPLYWQYYAQIENSALVGYDNNEGDFTPYGRYGYVPYLYYYYYYPFPAPKNLHVTSVSTHTATFSWSESSGATQYQMVYSTDPSFNPDEATNHTSFSGLSGTLDNLSSGTKYYAAVRALQNGDYSRWSDICEFQTAYIIDAANSYTDDFENSNEWMLVNQGEYIGSNQWYWGAGSYYNYNYSTTFYSYRGTKSLYITDNASSGGTQWSYSYSSSAGVYAYKLFNLDADKLYEFDFNYKIYGQSGCDYFRVALVPMDDVLALKAGWTGANATFGQATAPSDWQFLTGKVIGNQYQSSWNKRTCKGISVPSSGVYAIVVAWLNDSSGGYNPPVAIDDVEMSLYYEEPTEVHVENVTARTARLIWQAADEGCTYEVYYAQTPNQIPDINTEPSASGITNLYYDLSNLQPSTSYNAYVRAKYGENEFSKWVNTYFSTEASCLPIDENMIRMKVTAETAEFDWVAGPSGENAWVFTYGTSEDDFSQINVSTPHVQLTNLTPNTNYVFYIQANCGTQDGLSEYEEYYFTTMNCDESDLCSISYDLFRPSYWAYWRINVYDAADEILVAAISPLGHPVTNGVLMLCPERTYSFEAVIPGKSAKDGKSLRDPMPLFTFREHNGDEMFSLNEWPTNDNSIELLSWYEMNCNTCSKPQNLTMAAGPTSAMITWEGTATSYALRYKLGDNDWVELEEFLNAPSYAISYEEGTYPSGTEFQAQVVAICGENDYSSVVSCTCVVASCSPEDMCNISYELNDSYGDGWNGNAIVVFDEDDNIVASLTMENGSTESGTLALCAGNYSFAWQSGQYSSECSYTIFGPDGSVVFSGSNALSEPVDYSLDCEIGCLPPTNLSAVAGIDNAIVNWQAGGDENQWTVQYYDESYTIEVYDFEEMTELPEEWDYYYRDNVTGEASIVTEGANSYLQLAINSVANSNTPWLGIEIPVSLGNTFSFHAKAIDEPITIYYGWYSDVNDDSDYAELEVGTDVFQTITISSEGYSGNGWFWFDIEQVGSAAIDNVAIPVLNGDWGNDISVNNTPSINLTDLNPGTVYQVRVKAVCDTESESGWKNATFTTLPANTKTFIASEGDWDVPTHWQPEGVPTYDIPVMINGAATITTNTATAAKVTISPTGSVTINNGGALITYEIINTDASRLIVNDGGQLMHGNSNVQATIKKEILAYDEAATTTDGWYLIASPLANDYAPTEVMLSNTYDLYTFNNENVGGEWVNYKNMEFSTLDPMKGYLYANSNDVTIEFAGKINPVFENDEYSPYVTRIYNYDNGYTFEGWFLIGNPLACNAYPITGNLDYYGSWQSTGNLDYLRMNDNHNDFIAGDGPINPTEGVMVYCNSNTWSQYVCFSISPYEGGGVNPKGGITLNLSKTGRESSSLIDRAIVRFGEGSTLNKLMLNTNHTSICIPQGGKDFAIVRSAAEGEIPVKFKAESNGTYVINSNTEGVEMDYLHLIDNLTGADVDLLATPSYSFDARTTDYSSRFKLVFKANENSTSTGSTNFAYFNGSNWTVNNLGEASLQIIDMMGRVLRSEQINGNAEININQPSGVYMLRLINGNSVKMQKVVVR